MLKHVAFLLLFLFSFGVGNAWGHTYTRLESIASIDASAVYVLGIDGTGFHYSGTSSWGLTALPSAQTPIYYTLTPNSNNTNFTASTTISNTTYYLTVPTSNTFTMSTSSATLIIGTTQSNAGDDKAYAIANSSTTTRHIRRNGTSGLRSYAGNTGALAFFYKVGCANPTSLTNGTITSSTARLSWTDNTNTNCSYEIYRSTSSTAPAANATPTTTVNTKYVDLNGLSNSTTYNWWVRAKDKSNSAIKSAWVKGTNFTTTAAVSCSNKVTLSKGSETNGTFTLNKSNGSYDNCEANFVVTVSNITPTSSAYYCTGVTATGGNSTVTGPDGSGNYTVTYTKGNNITSTITANFAAKTVRTVTFMNNGVQYGDVRNLYEGDAVGTLPSNPSSCKTGTVFVGWSETEIGVTPTNTAPTFITASTVVSGSNKVYHAVFATDNSGSWEMTAIDNINGGSGYAAYDGNHTANTIGYTSSNVMANSGIQFKSSTGYLYTTTNFGQDITSIVITSTSANWSVYTSNSAITSTPSSGALTISSNNNARTFTVSASGQRFIHIKGGASTPVATSIKVYYGSKSGYFTTCCTPLGSINGSVSVTNDGCGAGELKATWKTNSEGIAGIASQVLHVYKASDDSEVTAKKITDITASTENQTQTISGLDNCTEYYVRVENISAGSPYCGDGWAGDKSANATTKGYSYSFTLTDGHVTKTAGTARETTCDGDIDYTFAAISGWVLPTSISVTNAGDENDNWTWDSSKGELIIFAEGVTGNVSVIITATAAPCTPIVMSGVTVSGKDYPYDAVTLSWTTVEHADGYTVEIYDGETKIEGDDLDGGADSYTITTTLAANKTYTYKVKATSETPATYCESNWATAEFTTNDYPAATLTLHDANGSSDFTGSHKLFDVIELPSTAAACSKTFMGWSANAECSTAPEIAKGANYTLNALSQDLYAVYADITGGGTNTVEIKHSESSNCNLTENTNEAGKFGLNDKEWSVYGAKGGNSNNVGLNSSSKDIRLYYHANGGNTLTVTAPQTITSIGISLTDDYNNAWVKVNDATVEIEDGVYPINATSFVIGNANTSNKQVRFTKIDVNFTTPGTPSNYSTTCAATPVAEASPTNLNDIAAAGASGTITMSYEHVNTANVAVALYNDEACTEAFSGEWLTASLDGDKNITYDIAANTSYNNARSAYIKLTAPETSGTTDPAVVVIPVSQAKKPAVFTSLAELAAADVAANTNITVTLTNEVIKEIYYYPNNTSENNRKGIVFNVQKNDADVKIYFASGVVPTTWVAGGKVSGTLTDCPWKTYQSTWQLAPANTWAWDQLTYTAPPAIESIEIRGAASKKTYIDGQAFDHTGLTAIAIYDNSEEEDVTGYATWTYNPAKLSEGDTEVEVSAEYLGHSDSETVTGLTVNPIPNKTIAEFIAAGGTRCYLEGIVSNYTNTTKGYFDLTDASGTLYIYGCTSPSSFAAGDKVRVIAETYEYYQSTTHEAKNVEFVSKVSPVAITITDAGSLSVEKGLTLTINATTDPEGAVANIAYNVKAGSEDYASVEGNVVTGKAKGTATIIASIPAGDGYLANSVEFEVDVVEYFSITYEENGGSTVADVAKALALPNPLPETTKENYTFNGWFTTSTFDAETEAVAGATLTGNVTLYAKWTEIPVWARTYGSNVTLVGGGTSHEDANVVINAESYPAEKAGASKNEGTVSIIVPAGTNAVHFHGFAWNGQSVTVSVAASPAVTNLSASSFDLAGDAAGSSSSPYTITSNPVNHYNFFTFDAVEEATTFTFSKTSGSDNRFILYGVNAIYPEITLSPVSYDFENVRANATKEQVFTISANENVSGMLSASIIEDASSKYSVSPIEDNKVTVTFNPDGAESGTFTAKLKITASNASVIADLSGTAISAAAPMIVTDKSSIAFGRIEPNAEASAMVAVELQNIDEDGVTAELSGEDAGKFALSPTKLTADGNLVITPTTSAQGIFSATLTLSATDADDVVLPISMTVASKWATTYTSNVEVSANENKKVKVGSDETEFAARKTNTGATATIHLPMGTQKLHLHMVAWKGEEGTVTVSGDCFSSSKSIEVPANDVVSGATGTYTFTDAQALSYYHEIAIDNEIGAGGINVTVSKSGSRIVLFGVNQEGGTYEIEDDANISTLPENANVEVKNGVTLTVDAVSTLDNLIVEAGGKVTGASDLTVVNDLLIKTSLGNIAGDDSDISGVSGEIANSNISATGDVFIEIELTQEAEASEGWYAFSVPFPVDAMNGVYYGDTKLTNEVGYAIMSYHGDVRAQGLYGWKKYRGIMQPGVLYIITVGDTDYKTLRFKKVAGENIVASNEVSVNEYASETGNDQDGGWNGIGNPNLQVSNYSATNVMQFLDHSNNCFRPRISSQINLLVGSAFMMQIQTTTTITISVGNSGSIALAPARERSVEENTLYELKLRNTETNAVEDNLFFSASEDATNTYEIGRDVAKFSMGAAKCAQMYVPAYGTQLCAADFPLVNGQAEYPLAITAPAAGSYRIETPTVYEDATLYLTYEGNIIWDLTVSPYEAEFDKGQNNDYGLMLVRKAPQVTTGVENVQGDKTQCTKVILNDHVYILRDAQLYDVTGKAVK